jgi:hypothetical protein
MAFIYAVVTPTTIWRSEWLARRGMRFCMGFCFSPLIDFAVQVSRIASQPAAA